MMKKRVWLTILVSMLPVLMLLKAADAAKLTPEAILTAADQARGNPGGN